MAVSPITRDDASAAFFDAAADHRLLLLACAACGAHAAPGVATCPACGGRELSWAEAARDGHLVSWTTTYRKDRRTGELVGTTIALVELAEGPWLTLQCQGLDPETMAVGFPVAIGFEHPEGGEAVPVAVTP